MQKDEKQKKEKRVLYRIYCPERIKERFFHRASFGYCFWAGLSGTQTDRKRDSLSDIGNFTDVYMVQTGFYNLSKFRTLGDVEQQKVWNEAKSLYEYVDGDRSLIILLYGIVTLSLILVFFLIAKSSLKQAYRLECQSKKGEQILTLKQELKELLNGNLHITLLTFPVLGVLMFTILPLVFMISMAFTNYSVEGNKLVLFDWVGLENFRKIFDFGDSLGQTFWSVFGWTMVWAVVATFSNYILGMLLALFINWKEIRAKKMWRFCFALTVAIPHFVTLLIIKSMLQPEGAVNILLRNL